MRPQLAGINQGHNLVEGVRLPSELRLLPASVAVTRR